MGRRKKEKELSIDETIEQLSVIAKTLENSKTEIQKLHGEFTLLSHVAYALKTNLLKMDEVGAIDLDEWPVAKRLVNILSTDGGLKFALEGLSTPLLDAIHNDKI
tara:strand:- start:133 stop:447 length:315 start_codon:yes stop_codon:yes gene_type:complete